MKKLICLIVLLALALFTSPVWAVNLVCDPQAGVTHYKISGDAFWVATQSIPAQPDGSLQSNVDAIPSGVHNIQVQACAVGVNWPTEVCSASTPFSFSKPTAPGVPTNMRLAP